MLSNNYKTALVTGASSGIGEATVHLLVKNNIKVYALARRKNKLNQLTKKTGCTPIVMDIRDSKSLEKLKKYKIDILVNTQALEEVLLKFLIQNPKTEIQLLILM